MRHVWIGILSIGCALGAVFIGCGDSGETGSTAAGGSGGTGGHAGHGGTGNTGGAPECTQNSECGTDTDCRKFTCNAGKCETVDVAAGTAATDATAAGDCLKTVCDGAG